MLGLSCSVDCALSGSRDQPWHTMLLGDCALQLCKVPLLSPGGQKFNEILSDMHF